MNPTKPTLITTFISSQPLTPLINHLARPELEEGLALTGDQDQEEAGEWKNHDERIFVITLEHQELADVWLMQLVINRDGEAPDAWQHATGQLERALRGLPAESEEALLGMTLIYQAVLPRHASPDQTFNSVLEQFQLRTSKGDLYTGSLASSPVAGGKLWLLETAVQDKRSVYLALGKEAEQASLTYNVLFDEDAALLWADTIAHKAYAMLRDYRPQAERHLYRQANKALTDRVETILAENLLPVASQSNPQPLATPTNSNTLATLNDLSTKAAKFTNATVALHQLQSALEIHRFNLKLAAQEFANRMGQESNPITSYHQQRLAHSLFRIQQDIAVASATQEAVNTALNYLRAIEEHEQTVLAKRQEKSNDKNQLIIAVFGLIIGLGQIIDGNPIIMLTRFVVMVVIGLLAWWWYQRR